MNSVTVIGSDRETVQRLASRYQLLRINHHIPPMGLAQKKAEIIACADFVALHPARYVFIAVGSPQQELVAQAISARSGVTGLRILRRRRLGLQRRDTIASARAVSASWPRMAPSPRSRASPPMATLSRRRRPDLSNLFPPPLRNQSRSVPRSSVQPSLQQGCL